MHARHRFTSIALLLGVGLAGCYTSDARSDPPPPVTADLACAPSELAMAWATESMFASVFPPARVDLAPGGALAVIGGGIGGAVVRASDGAVLGQPDVVPSDAAWERYVALDGETNVLSVRAIQSGAVLREARPTDLGEGWFSALFPALTDDGAALVVLECAHAPATGEHRTFARHVDVASGREARVEIDRACDRSQGATPLVMPVPGARAVVLARLGVDPAFGADGTRGSRFDVARVDFDGATSRIAHLGDGEPAPVVGESHLDVDARTIIAASLSDDGRELVVVGVDGRLTRHDAETFAPIGEPRSVVLAVANGNTFIPSIESPAALSPARRWLALVESPGQIAVRDAASGELATSLAIPFAPSPERDAAAMALRWTDDGLLVVTSGGSVRYACGGRASAPARPPGELAIVSAEGPAEAREGEVLRFAVELENASLPTIRTVTIEGAIGASFSPLVRAYASSAGAHTVIVTAHDGVRTAEVERAIRIAPLE